MNECCTCVNHCLNSVNILYIGKNALCMMAFLRCSCSVISANVPEKIARVSWQYVLVLHDIVHRQL